MPWLMPWNAQIKQCQKIVHEVCTGQLIFEIMFSTFEIEVVVVVVVVVGGVA